MAHFTTMRAATPGPHFRLAALAGMLLLAAFRPAAAQDIIGGSGPGGAGGGMGSMMGGGRGNSGMEGNRSIPLWVPPDVPRLEAPIVTVEPSRDPRRRANPALADYIYDPFYAPLAARVGNEDLSSKQRLRIEAYLATKLALQNELRNKLDSLTGADALGRQRALAVFAAEQTPSVTALEAEAEALREELIKGEFLQENINWIDFRTWKLGRDSFQSAEIALSAQYQVMIGASYYQKNLLPTQRRLLREIATDLHELSEQVTPEPVVGGANVSSDSSPLFSFAPETARLRLPPNLPDTLMAKILAYEKEKSALKQELNDAIKDADDALFAVIRNRAAAEVAGRQEARLAALDLMAEDIRRDFAAQPQQPRPPALPAVSPGLADQIKVFVAESRSRQERVSAMLAAVGRWVPVQGVSYGKDESGADTISVRANTRGQDPARVQRAQEIIEDYRQDSVRRNAALERQRTAIREAVGAMFRSPPGPDREREIDQFLESYEDTMDRQSLWYRYEDYRTAVLQPGLSPEQRRLLFDAGLGELKLSLPNQLRRPAVTQLRPMY